MGQMPAVAHNTGETNGVAHGRLLKWNRPPLGSRVPVLPKEPAGVPQPQSLGPAEIHVVTAEDTTPSYNAERTLVLLRGCHYSALLRSRPPSPTSTSYLVTHIAFLCAP